MKKYKHYSVRWEGIYYFTMGDQKHLLEEIFSDDDVVISEQEIEKPYVLATRCGKASVWNNPVGMIQMGDKNDCRCSYVATYLSCPQYEEDAKEAIEKLKNNERARQDAYYSQKWV
jgi:hypothetical protein